MVLSGQLNTGQGTQNEALKCIQIVSTGKNASSSENDEGRWKFLRSTMVATLLVVAREEKALGIMAQKFLMLFLTSDVSDRCVSSSADPRFHHWSLIHPQDRIVNIIFAAKVLLGDSKNEITEFGRYKSKHCQKFCLSVALEIFFFDEDRWISLSLSLVFLAKVRRLYDIANVLSTINLITKVTDPSYRGPRPAFQYIGPRTEIIHHAESKLASRRTSRAERALLQMSWISSIRRTRNPIRNIHCSIISSETYFWIAPYQDSIHGMVCSAWRVPWMPMAAAARGWRWQESIRIVPKEEAVSQQRTLHSLLDGSHGEN